jgi:hypothetical protein
VVRVTSNDGTANPAWQLAVELEERETKQDGFGDLLDEIGDCLAETDVRNEAWR